MLVHDSTKGSNSIISGIYASAQQRDKEPFWNHLLQLNTVINLPCCIIGDFNALTSPFEKRGADNILVHDLCDSIPLWIQATPYLYRLWARVHMEETDTYAFNL